MGRHRDPLGVARAQISGIAAGYAHMKRIDRAGAMAEIGEVLAKVAKAERQGVLNTAAAHYVEAGTAGWWYGAALELLDAVGADLGAARAIWAAQPRSGFQVGSD